ncbi:sensor histidine kinase [Paenibacillus thermoaerophilus]|uniref:Sensor histidine kinase n=1 Tax=Paenibacillus thermoaerophilus TaxID=1215385 RepID=A0ABW2V4E6_9BACL|nr:sensor histidine kinase [Paenibacillus thermoaerophilus]TMV18439.1 sensor histidine kinase [Paenibacillus thermoaerophilus]
MRPFRLRAYSGLSFRQKLIAVSVACILLPTCLTLAVSGYLTRDAVKDQAVSNAQESLALADGYVSNLLQYMLYVANYIQNDSEINATLKALAFGNGGDELSERLRLLSKIDNISSVGEQVFVTILQPDGRYFTSYPVYEYDPRLLFEEPWFRELRTFSGLSTYWAKTRPTVYMTEKTNHPYQISIGRTLRIGSDASQIYGYVVVTMLESRINKIFRNLAVGQEMMLVDEEGRILSHKDPHRIGERLEYLQAADGNSNVLELDGERYLLTRRPIAYGGWELVSLLPYGQATANITGIFNSVFLLLIVLFCLFLMLLVYLIQTFTKPLVKLGRVAASVQRGNLDVRSGIRSRDEIGSLGASLDQMLDRVGEMIREITLQQARKRKAELDMLQAQINPHFLFNVLNSIRMKVLRKGDRESAEMIASLSKLLRMTIERNKEMITLHEEIEIAADYVLLMNMRQKEKAELRLDISADVFLQKVPRFMLQPIIENAMIHGLQQGPGTIGVTARIEGDTVEIVVEDDGEGMSAETLERLRADVSRRPELSGGEPGGVDEADGADGAGELPGAEHRGFSSIGLRNVSERMAIIFGARFRMTIDSEPGRGTRVAMSIPRQEVQRNDV